MFEIPNQTELKEFKVTLAYARDKFESSKLSQLNQAKNDTTKIDCGGNTTHETIQ
jgi:hypothetical protein